MKMDGFVILQHNQKQDLAHILKTFHGEKKVSRFSLCSNNFFNKNAVYQYYKLYCIKLSGLRYTILI